MWRLWLKVVQSVDAAAYNSARAAAQEEVMKLEQEAADAADLKGWCDKEIAEATEKKDDATAELEKLNTKFDSATARSKTLKEEVATLQQELAELSRTQSEMDDLRAKEKAAFEKNKPEMEMGLKGVKLALKILNDYYATAAAHGSSEGAGSGIIGMLEVIESDFARLEADTKASEASAQKEYDEFMTDSEVDKTKKSTDIEHKTAKKQDETQALTVKREDLEGTQKELDAALAYFDKLKPSCVDAGVSYEDRVARRKEEIVSFCSLSFSAACAASTLPEVHKPSAWSLHVRPV